MKKNSKIYMLVLSLSLCLLACQATPETDNTIRVGIISGPETKIIETAKQVLHKRYKLDLKIIEFNDYTMPNTALSDGNLDANIFQHQPYLDAVLKAKNYSLIAIGKTFIYPMGIYSTKIKNLAQLADQAVVAIPNDPSNEARALLVLAQAGLIGLKSSAGTDATASDIIQNPKKLQIKELDAAQLSRVLTDVTLAVITDDYAVPAGLYLKDALYAEAKDSPYANLVVIREADRNKLKLKQLVAAMHSAEVVKAAQEVTQGQAVPAW